jgi:acyl phosphate:glycerol-3-phosphate acyltransferase
MLGSIPFGYILCKLVKRVDIRTKGSGNIGATNVTRVTGIYLGVASFVLDFLKGFLPYYIGYRFLNINPQYLLFLSSLSIIGHDFSPFLKFKGGKGASTSFALIVAFNVKIALFILLIWISVLIIKKYVSLASMISFIFLPIFIVLFNYSLINLIFGLFFCILGISRHYSNIIRLINRTENRI